MCVLQMLCGNNIRDEVWENEKEKSVQKKTYILVYSFRDKGLQTYPYIEREKNIWHTRLAPAIKGCKKFYIRIASTMRLYIILFSWNCYRWCANITTKNRKMKILNHQKKKKKYQLKFFWCYWIFFSDSRIFFFL